MDKDVSIKIVRDSDNSTFGIGTGYDWKFLKNGIDGFGSCSNEITYVDNGVHDGGLLVSYRLGRVDRTIKCAYVFPSNNENERKRVTSFFNVKDSYKVYITHSGRTLWAEGIIYKSDLSIGADVTARMDLYVVFTFASPYWKSLDPFGKDIASKTGMIAFPFLCSINTNPIGITGSIFNFAQKVDITNNGDADTYCKAVFKAKGGVVNPKLMINDQYVRVLDTMVDGDVIEMDFTSLPPTVRKNGNNYIGHCDRTSSFTNMIMKVGDLTIEYDADDGGSNLSVSVYYNELFASI